MLAGITITACGDVTPTNIVAASYLDTASTTLSPTVASISTASTTVPPTATLAPIPTTNSISTTVAQTATPAPTKTSQLPYRADSSLVYDNVGQQPIIFGGIGSAGNLNDTWAWNGDNWTKLASANALSPRNSAAIASSPDQVILFGGVNNDGNTMGDTWVWNGKDWSAQHPTNSPPPRNSAAMTYDPVHQVTLLFSGDGGNSRGPNLLADMWSWDGKNWTQLHPTTAPKASYNAGIAYDNITQQVVLFGGTDIDGFNNTWSWDGTNWTQLQPAISPPALLDQNSFVYDRIHQNFVLYIRAIPKENLPTQTWTWDGKNWTQRD